MGGGGGQERERERERDRQTDRQTDGQRQTDKADTDIQRKTQLNAFKNK